MTDTAAWLRFLAEVEAALPGWIGRVADAARAKLQGRGPGLGRIERRDLLAAQAVLEAPLRFSQAWSRELVVGWQDAPAETTARSGPAPALLTLKDEHEVDEEIELSRLIQDLESRAEATLRDLRALCTGLRGETAIRPDAPPLHPPAVAQALGRAVRSLPLSPPARLALVKALVPNCAEVLVDVLGAQLRQLKAAGVQPAGFRVTLQAQRLHPADDTPPQGRIQAVLQQLTARAGVRPDGAVSDAWMQGVLQAVLQEAAPAPRMRQVFERLAEPGRHLARAEPALWRQPEHVWWQLLDKLLALCAVLEARPGGAQDQVAARCEAAITRLCTELPPDSALCRQALEQVTEAGRTIAEGQESADSDPHGAAPSGLAQVVREQMAQQLRASAAPGSMRRFLMGPWLRVLVAALDPETGDPARARRCTDWVDRLLAAVQRPPAGDTLGALLDTAREGLAAIGLPQAQIDTWLFDLTMRLHEVQEDQDDDAPQWKHEDLPTVPIELHGAGVHSARARRDRVAWINGLRVGDICRLFVDTAWCTAQLIVDPIADAKGDDVYVFQSRQPRRQHSLTRRALERLRSEGLATTVEMGAFIAKALDTVAAQLDEIAPARTSR